MEKQTPIKILFAEDDPDEHRILRQRIEDLGYHLDLAPDILDAFSILVYGKNRLNYKLALVDLMMDAGFLGNQYPHWRQYGGLCLCEELFKNEIDVSVLVYSYVIDESTEDGIPILRYLEDRGFQFVRKTQSTATLDGLDAVTDMIAKIVPLE